MTQTHSKYSRFLPSFYYSIEDLWFDYQMGIKTRGVVEVFDIDPVSPNITHARRYQATRTGLLKKFCKQFEIAFQDKVVLDVGAGFGRMLFFAASMGAKDLIGVDIGRNFKQGFADNVTSYRQKTKNRLAQFHFFERDILNFHPEQPVDIIYLYNPFDDRLMFEFSQQIKLWPGIQTATVIYANPIRVKILQARGFQVINHLDTGDNNTSILSLKLKC